MDVVKMRADRPAVTAMVKAAPLALHVMVMAILKLANIMQGNSLIYFPKKHLVRKETFLSACKFY
jgi:hypothetical protein